MSNICIVDIDGVVANSDTRFARATTDGRVNWKVAFDPALVTLDTLILGAVESIKTLEERHYSVLFLTSRPEHMRAATEAWLAQHGLQTYELLMKPASAQYVKTVVWKAETITQIVKQTGAEMILLVDDEEANRVAVQKAVEELGFKAVCLPSLEESSRYHEELVKGMLSWVDDGIEEDKQYDEALYSALDTSNDGAAYVTQGSHSIHVSKLLEDGGRFGLIVKNDEVVILEDNLGSINAVREAIYHVVPDLAFTLEWKSAQYPY
jgi:HAD superfamily, subfamily IIIB (Acid phosphatase)